MKYILLVVVAALVAVAVACGGSDDNGGATATPQVRSQKGLQITAALQAAQRAGEQLASGDKSETGGAAAPGYSSGAEESASGTALTYAVSNDGLTVTGYGMAATDADSAILELYFSTTSVYPRTETGSSGSSGSSDTPVAAQTSGITEADLQPVIDALVGAGVARSDIEYIGGSYYDPYYASATLRVSLRDVVALDGIVTAAKNAVAGLTDIYLQSSYVNYTVSDCAALESAALNEAIADSDARSSQLASALRVTRGAIRGASNDAYWPFGGTACGGGYTGPYPLGGIAYAEGQTSQVTVYATVSVTYAIQ